MPSSIDLIYLFYSVFKDKEGYASVRCACATTAGLTICERAISLSRSGMFQKESPQGLALTYTPKDILHGLYHERMFFTESFSLHVAFRAGKMLWKRRRKPPTSPPCWSLLEFIYLSWVSELKFTLQAHYVVLFLYFVQEF